MNGWVDSGGAWIDREVDGWMDERVEVGRWMNE